MPDHVHLLIGEPSQATLAEAIKSLKQGVSGRLIDKAYHFWQKRYYDFNIRDYSQFQEKIRYIHRNPVERELCKGTSEGNRRALSRHRTAPLKPKEGLNGAPARE